MLNIFKKDSNKNATQNTTIKYAHKDNESGNNLIIYYDGIKLEPIPYSEEVEKSLLKQIEDIFKKNLKRQNDIQRKHNIISDFYLSSICSSFIFSSIFTVTSMINPTFILSPISLYLMLVAIMTAGISNYFRQLFKSELERYEVGKYIIDNNELLNRYGSNESIMNKAKVSKKVIKHIKRTPVPTLVFSLNSIENYTLSELKRILACIQETYNISPKESQTNQDKMKKIEISF